MEELTGERDGTVKYFSKGFFYHKMKNNGKNKNIDIYRCATRSSTKCTAITTHNKENDELLTTGLHIDTPEIHGALICRLKSKMLKLAFETTTPIKEIHASVLEGQPDEIKELIKFESVKSTMNRKRDSSLCKTSENITSFADSLKNSNLVKEFFQGSVTTGISNALIFISESMLKLLNEKEFMTAFIEDSVSINTAVWVLMNNRSSDLYDKVWSKIRELVPELKIHQIKCGFKNNAVNALHDNMTNSILVGTWHHYILVQERLEDPPAPLEPICSDICDIVDEIRHKYLYAYKSNEKELNALLKNLHLKALLETHDAIAKLRDSPQSPNPRFSIMPGDERTEAVRMVGLRRLPDEPLGLTVQVDEVGNLIIARILEGSTAAKQGLLRIGEVILEVNGKGVHSPDELQEAIMEANNNLTLKLAPGIATNGNKPARSACYMRALFDYYPQEDTLLPCMEIGLAFQKGDILQIVDQADPNWWQARRVEGKELGPPGLIPSLELEERRKAFVPPEADFVHKISICGTRISKKKKRKMYESKSNGEFDAAELLLYEEVARTPPFRRKTLALVGPRGVGRRTLKNRLINSDPDKFGTIVPFTSRPPRVLEENGKSYWFTDREGMEVDIREHRYLEHGDHGGHLYGTKLDSVRDLIRAGKMCVLDCSPAALKILHNSTEFMPYVIFIAAPGMEQLKSLYDLGRSTGASNRNLTFDRQSSIRYSSRRARTLESLASLYEEDDLKSTLEESAALQRAYEKYIDQVIVNEDFDNTFRQVIDALNTLATEHQWVPVNWIY